MHALTPFRPLITTLLAALLLAACDPPIEGAPEGTHEYASSRWCDVYCQRLGDSCGWTQAEVNDCARSYTGLDWLACKDALGDLAGGGDVACDAEGAFAL